jgi:Rod binding protein
MKTNIDAHLPPLDVAKPAPAPQAAKNRTALKKSCQDFEAIFVQSMLKAMRKTVPEGGLFARSNAVTIFEDMLDQHLAADMAKNQSIGLAEQMYRQMEKHLPEEP